MGELLQENIKRTEKEWEFLKNMGTFEKRKKMWGNF